MKLLQSKHLMELNCVLPMNRGYSFGSLGLSQCCGFMPKPHHVRKWSHFSTKLSNSLKRGELPRGSGTIHKTTPKRHERTCVCSCLYSCCFVDRFKYIHRRSSRSFSLFLR